MLTLNGAHKLNPGIGIKKGYNQILRNSPFVWLKGWVSTYDLGNNTVTKIIGEQKLLVFKVHIENSLDLSLHIAPS